MPSKVCVRDGCVVEFTSYPSQNKKYCSNACRYACAKYRDSLTDSHGKHRITEPDAQTKLGVCSICGPDTEIRLRKNSGTWRCKNAIRRLARLQTYGLSNEEYTVQLLLQDNCCFICGDEFHEQPRVDHDHTTGQVRGLLCNMCNIGLGMFRDNPEYLDQAALYLRSWPWELDSKN